MLWLLLRAAAQSEPQFQYAAILHRFIGKTGKQLCVVHYNFRWLAPSQLAMNFNISQVLASNNNPIQYCSEVFNRRCTTNLCLENCSEYININPSWRLPQDKLHQRQHRTDNTTWLIFSFTVQGSYYSNRQSNAFATFLITLVLFVIIHRLVCSAGITWTDVIRLSGRLWTTHARGQMVHTWIVT